MPNLPLKTPKACCPSIFLEYGLDGSTGEDSNCEVCERGMRFHARWQFEIGTVLQIAFSIENATPSRIEAEGMVVECRREGRSRYLTTLAFVEPPRDLKLNLGKVSARLTALAS